MPRYLVGIDLGTTNTALAFVDTAAKKKGGVKLHSFPIQQLIGPGQMAEQPLLPSFLYLPGEHDLPEGATALPWDANAKDVVGQFARQHGAKLPGRLVSSAKSWLCHPGVDRTAPLLPWSAPPEVERLSPLTVSTRYLRHLVEAWNAAPKRAPEDHLEETPVVLTVPASFDDVARNLTAEAAKQAGLKYVTLLEEPQAAFYCWLGMHPPAEAGKLSAGMRCVVVDIGGGTTDLSLIRAGEEQGELTFVRDAVGDHLLLGGDNMDLALAKAMEGKFSSKLDAGQFAALIQACRQAKEILLGPNAPEQHTLTIAGRGRSLIGGTLSATITPQDMHAVLFDGFFPIVDYGTEPKLAARSGLQEMGLPYVSDPAISKYLSAFLKQHLPDGLAPDAILFNGGVFQPQVLQDRIIELMKHWYDKPGKPWKPLVLTNPSLDLAVSWGAAYSAWLKSTGAKRIGGGSARSYYLGIQTGQAEATASTTSVVCVVPRGMAEGEEIAIAQPEFQLALGQPVLFPLFTSSIRADDEAGEVLSVKPDQLLQLPPLHTILRGGKRSGTKLVPVTLVARSTEIGTLELYCVSREGNRWKLEFNVRDVMRETPSSSDKELSEGQPVLLDVFPEEKILAAGELIRASFQKGIPTPQELTKQLEASLELGRQDWPTGLCRRMWDFLTEIADVRVKSPAHLSRWYNLTGFVLRPGFGDAIDRYRVEALWKMITATASGSISGGNKLVVPEGGADYWIMWRRVAGGLNGALQQAMFARLKPTLLPTKNKTVAKPGVNELAEMWRTAASLERLDVKTKETLGDILVAQVKKSPIPPYLFWSLTRFGARVQFYGPLNTVLHPMIAQRWLDALIEFTPQTDNERLGWAFCMAQLARCSGLRALDVSDEHRTGVAELLRGMAVPEAWPRMVEELVEAEGDEQSRLFGESLPIGLRLAHSGG